MTVPASTIELVEWHADTPEGRESAAALAVPNVLRINGDIIWASKDHPAEVGPVGFRFGGGNIDGAIIPVTMLARLADGGHADPKGSPPAAELSISDDEVRLNGKVVAVEESGITILHRHIGTNFARVRLALFARRFTVTSGPWGNDAPPLLYNWCHPPGVIPPSIEEAERILTWARVRESEGKADPVDMAAFKANVARSETRLQREALTALNRARAEQAKSAREHADWVESATREYERARHLSAEVA